MRSTSGCRRGATSPPHPAMIIPIRIRATMERRMDKRLQQQQQQHQQRRRATATETTMRGAGFRWYFYGVCTATPIGLPGRTCLLSVGDLLMCCDLWLCCRWGWLQTKRSIVSDPTLHLNSLIHAHTYTYTHAYILTLRGGRCMRVNASNNL